MRNSFIMLFACIFSSQFLLAQVNAEKPLIGTVVSDTIKLSGISVINTTSKMMAVTDNYGCFYIKAKVGDILYVSGIDYKQVTKYVYKHEYNLGSLVVDMVFNSVELEEVIVNKYPNITAEKLGIISSGMVKFTPQERKLYANSGGILGLYSVLSGERKMLKMNVEYESKLALLKKMEYMLLDSYYTKTLKIPPTLIKGFQYYCIENAEFVASLKGENKMMSKFLIVGLASEFNEKQTSDK